ncbi:MAG: hypothetical protein JW804_08025 [Sedimentisphaerales bacterium]|nr:hypothetical protein [Sedimentisphaerales bacterium]
MQVGKLNIWPRNAKRKIYICIVYISFICISAKSQDNISDSYTIIFNPLFHQNQEKWRAPYHKTMMYAWFTARVIAPDYKTYMHSMEDQYGNGVKYIGYYYSATTTHSKESGAHGIFPEKKFPLNEVKKDWLLRRPDGKFSTWPNQEERYFLDVGLREVQDAILNRAILNAKKLKCNVLTLDNWYYKYGAPAGLEEKAWTEKCMLFLKRARELTTANNLKLVVNHTSPPQYWIEFAPYLDGSSYEMGCHPTRLRSRDLYEQELSSYQEFIAMGKSIFLYTDRAVYKGDRWDKDGRKAAATVMLVMPKEQHYWGGIYVCSPHYEVWPVGGWAMWPEQLGKPLGPREWDGDTVTRKFENGLISVTVGEKPKFNISIEY